jgi:hypothetical protein
VLARLRRYFCALLVRIVISLVVECVQVRMMGKEVQKLHERELEFPDEQFYIVGSGQWPRTDDVNATHVTEGPWTWT